MSQPSTSFGVGIDFQHVLAAISKQIYETPLAFLRENVQNAVDAIRIQALRDGRPTSHADYRVEITVKGNECRIRDNGIGMTSDDLRELFWTIGASGKRNDEARRAGCVGMFGIGGFANLGVCDVLTVISQTQDAPVGTQTWLSEEVIRAAGSSIPHVQSGESREAAPRGTIVIGRLRQSPDLAELERYLGDFVRFAEENIYFNGKLISKGTLTADTGTKGSKQLSSTDVRWESGNLTLTGTLFEGPGHTLFAHLTGLTIGGTVTRFSSFIRFESGPLDVFKRGFKLCATKVHTQIGVSGRIDCDTLAPTAGRDSLDSDSMALVSQLATMLEWVAVSSILSSSELLEQHTRVFKYIVQHGWAPRLDNMTVTLADGSEATLGGLKVKAAGKVGIYFGAHQKHALSQIMQARGNLVVLLPSDHYKQQAVRQYLETHCAARSFSGVVEFVEVYDHLDRFERLFLSELETTVIETYEVKDARLKAGKLTEDIPVFLREDTSRQTEIYVDVRHSEIAKLRAVDIGPLLYSLIAAFCREYLGTSLRKRSPKFFGSGAVNLDLLAKKRSELWVLLKDDIQTISKKSERQVVRRTDVHTVRAGGGGKTAEEKNPDPASPKRAKLLRIEGEEAFADILGYYIRIPDGATTAFGDVIKEYDNRAAVWAGNKILLVASDAISSAFQFEIRTDHLIVVPGGEGGTAVEGASELKRPVQEMNEGLYFPLPKELEAVLVPKGDEEIRIEVSSGDWLDLKTSNAWKSREGT